MSMADPYRPRAGYAVAIFGSCSAVQLARLLTTVTHLRATGTQFPIVAMVARSCATDSTLRAELASESLDVAVVEPIERARCSGKKKPKADRRAQYYEQLFTKLHLWSLTQYDALLYLDSDVAVVRPIDSVLRTMLREPRYKEVRTGQGCLPTHASMRYVNTGVWGIRPSHEVHTKLLDFVASGRSSCVDGDQSAIEEFSKYRQRSEVLQLHTGYNMKGGRTFAMRTITDCLRRQSLNESDVHVVHWAGGIKPEQLITEKMADPIERLAHESYMREYRQRLRGLSATPLGQRENAMKE